MSMPNRCCVNERRLDIIEAKLGIENSVAELNRAVGLRNKGREGCGKYFQHGAGEFICGGALHGPDGKRILCANCTKDEGVKK